MLVETVRFLEILQPSSGALGTVPSSVGCSSRKSTPKAPGGEFCPLKLPKSDRVCFLVFFRNSEFSDFFKFVRRCAVQNPFQSQNAGTGFATERCCCSPLGQLFLFAWHLSQFELLSDISKCHASQVICIQRCLAALFVASDLCKSGLKHVQKTRGFTNEA